ncbi:MAG: UDP-N-acetylmuramoyl-tripeptide--D-alanyl-D-alanine ligase, partial [Solirubrobacterales bacterium]
MITLDGERLAAAAGAEVLGGGVSLGPRRAVIDSREVAEGDLFVGLRGEHADGGRFAAEALRAGAWGAIVTPDWARELAGRPEAERRWLLSAPDPLASLQSLARHWRQQLGARVVGITGSTGKTSVKDVCRAILPGRVHVSPENYNTEIGLSLAVLAAAEDTEALVLEMGMRGPGQVAELCAIAAPDIGVITNVGPVHMELLGSVEAIAAAKAEIIDGLTDGGTAVVPAEAGALEAHLERADRVLRFGEGGDVRAKQVMAEAGETDAMIETPAGKHAFKLPFVAAHNLDNALAAIAAGVALGMPLEAMAERAPGIVFSRLRGELVELPGNAILINDSYNANPISMRAALDHLASLGTEGRRLAVLGEMRELGPEAAAYHREIGAHARERGVELLIGVGELGAEYEPDERADDAEAAADALAAALRPGDAVLVKGSRAVGLE